MLHFNQETKAGDTHLAQESRGERQTGGLGLPPLSSLGPNSLYEGLELHKPHTPAAGIQVKSRTHQGWVKRGTIEALKDSEQAP